MADFDEGGPIKRAGVWVAGKVADFLLGGDIMAPDRPGEETEIDWEGMVIEKPRRTVVATMPRIQLELALGAAERRVKVALEAEGVKRLMSEAMEVGEDDVIGVKLAEDCAMTMTGLDKERLRFEMNGTGEAFEVLRDEVWSRASEMVTKKPESPIEGSGL